MPSLFHNGWERRISPYINHFLQPDTIIPGVANSQSWNRYSYVGNNPVRFSDPSGHMRTDENGSSKKGCSDPNYCYKGKPKKPPVIQPSGTHGVPDYITELLKKDPRTNRHECLVACHNGSGRHEFTYSGSEEPEPYPWAPDYLALEGGVPLQLVFGVDGVLTVDKYGRVYLGAGPSAGTSPLVWDINVSVSGGYILDENTTADEAHSFISKWSGGGCLGWVAGGCAVTGDPWGGNLDNPENWSVQVGVFSPQLGVAFPWSKQIYPRDK